MPFSHKREIDLGLVNLQKQFLKWQYWVEIWQISNFTWKFTVTKLINSFNSAFPNLNVLISSYNLKIQLTLIFWLGCQKKKE